jgi:2-methyl-1,2-propanediol dehydrogenase
VPNLYVVDGSSFATGGVVNPTSTVTALALRCARHLAADWETRRRATRPLPG